MAIWLVRAGRSGEYENKFLNEGKIYLTWERSNHDLRKLTEREDVFKTLQEDYPGEKKNTYKNWTGQVFPFVHEMKIGDWIVLPSKLKKSVIHLGEIKGEYTYDPKAVFPYFHFRKAEWFARDIPRSNFDQDILYSFGAFLTVCRIKRNNAEERIKALYRNGWRAARTAKSEEFEVEVENNSFRDLEESSKDQITKYIIRKFKGHGMARIVEEILNAKGYVTYKSPEGPDKGVDILAAPDPLGFGKPRLCVQVKTGDNLVDRPTLDQLLGSMQNFNAEQGLLVSWAGFKTSVYKEIPSQFFRIRLWDQSDIINELLSIYDKLPEDLKADLPLKRIWTLNISEEEALEDVD